MLTCANWLSRSKQTMHSCPCLLNENGVVIVPLSHTECLTEWLLSYLACKLLTHSTNRFLYWLEYFIGLYIIPSPVHGVDTKGTSPAF